MSTKGRVYLIAIPKTEVENPNSCYIWRSHAYGRVCPHPRPGSVSPKTPQQLQEYHDTFIEILGAHQKDNPIHACPDGIPPQYRMLSYNLDRDPLKRVITIDPPLSAELEKQRQVFVWKLGLLLKQVKRLESITKETSSEDLTSSLLRTRFSLETFFAEGNFNPKAKAPKPATMPALPQPAEAKKNPSFFKKCLDRIIAFVQSIFSFFTKKVSPTPITPPSILTQQAAGANEPLYIKGIQDILKSKKDILLSHQQHLRKYLPTSTLEELKKLDIDLGVNAIAAGG
jgi:hypothetical protein